MLQTLHVFTFNFPSAHFKDGESEAQSLDVNQFCLNSGHKPLHHYSIFFEKEKPKQPLFQKVERPARIRSLARVRIPTSDFPAPSPALVFSQRGHRSAPGESSKTAGEAPPKRGPVQSARLLSHLPSFLAAVSAPPSVCDPDAASGVGGGGIACTVSGQALGGFAEPDT